MTDARRRERGGFNTNIELMVAVAGIGILAAIAIPTVMRIYESRGPRCLRRLVTATLQDPRTSVPGCPRSDQPYVIVNQGGSEVLACPTPEKHLDTNPRFVRPQGGAWKLIQDLPPYAGGEIQFESGRTVARESPGRLSLHLLPGRDYRYFYGPLFFAVLSGIALRGLLQIGGGIRRRQSGEVVSGAVLAVLLGVPGYFVLRDFTSSTEFVLERAGAKVTRIDYSFGVRSSERATADCLGIVPCPGLFSRPARLVLVHRTEVGGLDTTEMESVARHRLDLVARLNQTILGP